MAQTQKLFLVATHYVATLPILKFLFKPRRNFMAMPVQARCDGSTVGVDTIVFKIHASRTEVQDTAQVRVPITALIQVSQSDTSSLDGSIREALQSFMTADWVFSAIRREGESVGYERVKLMATARVPHSEVYNLKERARVASREGLEIGQPEVSYKLPAHKVTSTHQALRMSILADVMGQLPDFAQVTGRPWHIAHVQFGVREQNAEESLRYSKGGYRSSSEEDVDSESGLTGGERFSLLAEVTLRSARP
jgi:hypothetical protein